MPSVVKSLTQAGRWWILVLLVFALDQGTKHWAEAALVYDQPVPLTSFFNFTLRYNPGAAFSFLADQSGWQRWFFTVLTVIVSAFLIVWIRRGTANGERVEPLGFALILAGALGNLYDRVMYGHVVDFIVLHYREFAWPAFNIADSAICAGVAVLILDMILKTRKPQDE